MLAIERRNAILAKLATDGKVIVSDLSEEFQVTEETIRRDLEKLDKEGLAKKTYGGAVVLDSHGADLPFNVRKRVNANFKEIIAQKIAGMIHDGDTVMLDASTTAISVTKYIKNRENITLVTNSVEILLELADKPGQLNRVLSVIAGLGANVISVHHERASEVMDVNGCFLRIELETRDFEHIEKITCALRAEGFRLF